MRKIIITGLHVKILPLICNFYCLQIIELILGYVMDSPKDLRNCSLADPVLSKIIQNSKQSWLFEEVS